MSPPIDPQFPVQGDEYRNTWISNQSIFITAASCLSGLILVIGATILLNRLTSVPSTAIVEPNEQPSDWVEDRTELPEGYSIVLPTGFRLQSREETERGYIVYRFRSSEGYRFTLAIIPDESIDRLSSLPKDISQALVGSVPELSQDIDSDVQPTPVALDGLPACVFRFYEKETYRGITFTYFMVALDRGRKLVLKIAGRYGGYSEQDEDITPPIEWYESLLTLRSVRKPRKSNEKQQL